MGTLLRSGVAVCSICGEPLNPKGDCLPCLLRTGLGESSVKPTPSALAFGDFEVEQDADGVCCELGHGAIGVPYLAADTVLRRRVALKVIEVPAAARGSQAVRERFLREARAAAALRHPNVAAVFQFGASPDGTHCYYAMELVEGETLGARVRRDGPASSQGGFGNCDSNHAGVDRCGSPPFDPSRSEAEQYHADDGVGSESNRLRSGQGDH